MLESREPESESIDVYVAAATSLSPVLETNREVVVLILTYTGIGVFSENRWGRRGLLLSWLLSASILPAWMLRRLLWASSGMSQPFRGQLLWTVIAPELAFYLVTFGASALALRRVGAAATHPRAAWVRVCASAFSGGAGAVVATLLILIAAGVWYAANN